MVFDCVYGRPDKRRLRQPEDSGDCRRLATERLLYHTLWEVLVWFLHQIGGTQVAFSNRRSLTARRGGTKLKVVQMATNVLWHGTQTEALELLQALSRNCSCVVTAEGVRLSTCAPHEMLSSDQRAVDGLLFARRIAERLRSEELDLAESEVGASS